MRLRAAIEAGILVFFLATTLVVVLWYNAAAPTGAEGDGDAREHVRSGDELYAAGRAKFNAAALKYWEALRLDPGMADAHFRIAAVYYDNGWNHEPLRALEEVEKIDPQYPGLHLLLGKIHNRMGNADEAFEALQKAVAAQPEIPEAHYYLGTVYQQKAMTEEAIREYEKAVEASLRPYSPKNRVLESHLQLGRIYKGRDYERAEAEFRKALSMDPESAEVLSELRNIYRQRAEYHISQKEYDRAMERYREILKIDPNNLGNVEIYMELGSRYEHNELYDEAFEMYDAARKLDPMNFSVYTALKQIDILRSMGTIEE
jgi:tetratricopeptide (TPR) repeat protein